MTQEMNENQRAGGLLQDEHYIQGQGQNRRCTNKPDNRASSGQDYIYIIIIYLALCITGVKYLDMKL